MRALVLALLLGFSPAAAYAQEAPPAPKAPLTALQMLGVCNATGDPGSPPCTYIAGIQFGVIAAFGVLGEKAGVCFPKGTTFKIIKEGVNRWVDFTEAYTTLRYGTYQEWYVFAVTQAWACPSMTAQLDG